MTLGLFWSRYELELHAKRLREIDAKYTFLIEYQKWNWLVSKVPEKRRYSCCAAITMGMTAGPVRTGAST